jgi:hypothetical protein
MPQLRWNDTDFLAFFAVVPTSDEIAISHNYELQRLGLRLLFTVWQLESVIQASVFRDATDAAVFTFAAYVRGEARPIDDQRGRFIEFEDCIVAPDRFWRIHADANPFDQERFPISINIRLAIDPDIQIAFMDYKSRT